MKVAKALTETISIYRTSWAEISAYDVTAQELQWIRVFVHLGLQLI